MDRSGPGMRQEPTVHLFYLPRVELSFLEYSRQPGIIGIVEDQEAHWSFPGSE